MAASCSQSLRNLSRSGPSAPWVISASTISIFRTGMKCSRSLSAVLPCVVCRSIVASSRVAIIGDGGHGRLQLRDIGRLDDGAPAFGVALHDLRHVLRRAAADLEPELFVLLLDLRHLQRLVQRAV